MKFLEFWNREAHRFKGNRIRHRRHAGVRSAAAARRGGTARRLPRRRHPALLSHQRRRPYDGAEMFLPLPRRTPARPEEFISCLAALDTAAEENDWRGRTFFAIGSLGTIRCLQLERDTGCIDHCAGVIMGEGRYDWRGSWEAAVNFFRRHPERPFIVPNPRPLLAGPGLRRHLHRRRRAGALH
ncbi:MAG: hypothetical protein L6W00_07295 [Lentisphaeria bacterium]|nr:MAG: hypothetical protein L6W00_07295 [Lentisphaeria bacterium]